MKFNMPRSEEKKRKIDLKEIMDRKKDSMDHYAAKYLEDNLPDEYSDHTYQPDYIENISFVYTYVNTSNLVEHSKTLTWLTRWLIVLTSVLTALTIASFMGI